MDAGTVGQLINLGSAGAVIIVVWIFLKTIKERDAEWRDFFTSLNDANSLDAQKRMTLTEKILEVVNANIGLTNRNADMLGFILAELKAHDAKVDARIDEAAKETAEAVKEGDTQKGRVMIAEKYYPIWYSFMCDRYVNRPWLWLLENTRVIWQKR